MIVIDVTWSEQPVIVVVGGFKLFRSVLVLVLPVVPVLPATEQRGPTTPRSEVYDIQSSNDRFDEKSHNLSSRYLIKIAWDIMSLLA